MRWSVAIEDYSPNTFPHFASGTSHVMNWYLVDFFGANSAKLDRRVWMEDVAHGLWFDQAVEQMESDDRLSVCRLFDYRFARDPLLCVSGALELPRNSSS